MRSSRKGCRARTTTTTTWSRRYGTSRDSGLGIRDSIMKRLLITIAIVAVGVAGLAAQQQGGARYTPAPGAKDKKAVLFNWAWYMGMLRGPQEIEAVVALEQKATGTLQINGQGCALSAYRVSTNYPNTGQRVQYACRLPNGQDVKNIEVV